MKKRINFGFAAVLIISACLVSGGVAFAQVAQAQSAPSASDLLSTVDALQTIDAARQNIATQINLQFAQIAQEVQHLISQPRDTTNEQEAFTAELGAVAIKLDQLSASADALNQIQVLENSLFATLQARMNALGM